MTDNRLPDCDDLVRTALAEDLGAAGSAGDVTSVATIAASALGSARLVARQEGILCGLPCAEMTFAQLDPAVRLAAHRRDGDLLRPGDVIAELEGSVRSLLAGERVALNFLTHLSGIATLAHRYMQEVTGTKARVVDTRKTIPGLRLLQKYAVCTGGGGNHRMGLYDAVLIKDNHVAAVGSAGEAVRRARAAAPAGMKLEVEIDRLDQLPDVLAAAPDIIMLDNFSLADMRRAVAQIGGRAVVEASGGVTLLTVRAIAETGVDIISVGALTHSAPALDIALDF